MQLKFYYCPYCGKIIALVKDSGIPTVCCGKTMMELIPGTSDGAMEKHVPVIKVTGNVVSVTVGAKIHPAEAEHYIEWIALETHKGVQVVYLQPDGKPHAEFVLTEKDEAIAAYEYCNIHGLWKNQI